MTSLRTVSSQTSAARAGRRRDPNGIVRSLAVDDEASTEFETAVDIDVLANDTAGTFAFVPSTIRIDLPPRNGTATVVSGQVRYTPNSGFSGRDSFGYRVRNLRGTISNRATVTVSVGDPPSPGQPLYDNDYAARARFRIPSTSVQGPDNISGFHLLFDETAPEYRSVANGGLVESSLGHDIRYEDQDGNKLPHALEWYDPATGRIVAWVKLDMTAGQSRTYFLYIGNPDVTVTEADPAGVWGDYEAAWNTRTGVDLSGNGRHLTPENVSGGGAVPPSFATFSGSSSILRGPTWSGFGGATELTVRSISRADGAAKNSGVFKQGPDGGSVVAHGVVSQQRTSFDTGQTNALQYTILTNSGRAFAVSDSDTIGSDLRVRHDIWAAGSRPTIWINGTSIRTPNTSPGGTQSVAGTGDVIIGAANLNVTTATWRGEIAFVALQRGVPSETRIRTEALNWRRPRLFHGVGSVDMASDANQSPVGLPASGICERGESVLIDVLAGAFDPENDPLTITAVTNGARGTTEIESGKVRYTSDGTGNGEEIDEFSYTISDGSKSSTSIVQILVIPPTASPPPILTANGDTASVVAGQTVDIDVLSNDVGDTRVIQSFTQPSNGTVTDQGGGVLRYSADLGPLGDDSFTYTITDDFAQTSTATVTVTQTAPDILAVGDTASVQAGNSVDIDVLANDVGVGLAVQSFTQPSVGTVTDQGAGVLRYSAPSGAGTSSQSFSYTIVDSLGQTSTASVSVSVTAGPPAIQANADTATVVSGNFVNINVLANDVGTGLSIQSFTQPAQGTVTNQGGGILRYTAPVGTATGTRTFNYTIVDSSSQTSTATVTVSVTAPAIAAVNDTASVARGSSTDVNVLANDTGQNLTISSFTQPSVGTVTNPSAGILRVTAAAAAALGTYTSQYTAMDAIGQTRTATLSTTITAAIAEFPAPAGPAPQTRTVNNRAELLSAIASAQPGNHIVLNDGIYSGGTITISRSGTAANPIVIRAANRVRTNGATVTTVGASIRSPIVVAGSHLFLYGLNMDAREFTNRGLGEFLISGSTTVSMQNLTIRRCFFHGERGNCMSFRSSTINGIRVENCLFTHRKWTDDFPATISAGDLNEALGLERDDNRNGFIPVRGRRGMNFGNQCTNITITRNCVMDFGPGLVKYSFTDQHAFFAGEGTASGVYQTLNVLFERNLILRCKVKPHGNPLFEYKSNIAVTRLNTFDETDGSITQRQGFGGLFVSNYIRNHDTGIRFFDRDHTVMGNVLDGGAGILEVMAGQVRHDVSPSSAKDGKYPATFNVVLAGNRRVAGNQPLYAIGNQFGASSDKPALDTKIEGYQTTHGRIRYDLHSGTLGPSANTSLTWPTAVRLTTSDVGLEGPLG